jgi:hypothetical protein|tara:strand:+ start:1160 stop:1393 length:234 start_codon:yes stop_codon:yes gene_type:complete
MINKYNPIIASQDSPGSRALAIKAMCAHCIGVTATDAPKNWRKDIKDCTAMATCPLWKLRPFSAAFSLPLKGSEGQS